MIVYLSWTNNTKAIAEIIQKYVGGDLATVELQTPYPENYTQTVDQVAKENASGYLPLLKTKIADIEKYDVIFFGFPTLGHAAASSTRCTGTIHSGEDSQSKYRNRMEQRRI
nr:flavodoxin [Flavobacterium sp. HSC-32F16]